MTVGFIGTGNMNGAIMKAYSGTQDTGRIIAHNRTRAKAETLAEEIKSKGGTEVTVFDNIGDTVASADIIVLGVEPQNFDQVMPQVASSYSKDKLLISIAAGISIAYLEGQLGTGAKIVRTMPNTPIMFGMGATAMVRNKNVTDDDFERARGIFASGGVTGEVTEDKISAIIGVSGSSPAYTYMYIDALIESGKKNGLSEELAKQFAAQTVMGAGRMVLESDKTPAELCDNVCSPGGTTIEAVKKLREKGFEELVVEGAQASIDRAEEMAK